MRSDLSPQAGRGDYPPLPPTHASLALELRLALFAECLDAFLEVFALPDGIEQPAHFGDRLQRSLRHHIACQLFQGLNHERRVASDFCGHLLSEHEMLPLRRDLVDKT